MAQSTKQESPERVKHVMKLIILGVKVVKLSKYRKSFIKMISSVALIRHIFVNFCNWRFWTRVSCSNAEIKYRLGCTSLSPTRPQSHNTTRESMPSQ